MMRAQTRKVYLPLLLLFACLLSGTAVCAGAAEGSREDTLNEIINSVNVAPEERVQALIDLSRRFQDKGFKRKALPLLEEAQQYSGQVSLVTQQQISVAMGSLLYDLGSYAEALNILLPVLEATSAEASAVRVSVLNELGMVYGALNNPSESVRVFAEGVSTAGKLADQLLQAKLLANQSRVLISVARLENLFGSLTELHALLAELPATRSKAELLISAANLYRSAFWYFDFSPDWMMRSYGSLIEAGEIASESRDARLLSYARGYLARLYEDDKSYGEALAISREAAFHANSIQSYESAYLWEWQIGRIQRSLGELENAVKSYQQAIETLEHVRQDLIDGSPYTFHQKVMPLFTGLSDILLNSVQALATPATRQQRYRYVQDILEQAKSAELQDYFQNDCVLPETSVQLDQIEAATATVYPVILPGRIEMLVSVGSNIHQFTSPIEVAAFEDLVNEFRDNLQLDQGDEEYLEIGEELYTLLIEQFDHLLVENDVKTLLFVPDGVLRTIPIAALYDGDSYLVEKYAVATTPGLKLTLPKRLEFKQASLFAGGISQAVQGFSGLPGVPAELRNLKANYGAAVLQDTQFMRDVVTTEMSSNDYSIIHIATHGHFDSNPQKSYLLAYDDKLTMNLLEKSIGFRKYLGDPLELLVLSACETAAGDNRAALGLAGVALKAGARSAVATLWQISDAATVQLIDTFYANASTQGSSKAKALQSAQISLINDPVFEHPSDWAPFLLIGNWL
jgi:CHAT domain-containing protein|tara:strand:- start:1541 stop:3769 length:2229 start_codon:yes stop_codon:yes gene_type:complete